MKHSFYIFTTNYTKGEIRPQPAVEYNTLALLDENSPLIKDNAFYIAKGKKEYDMIQFNNSSCIAITEKVKKLLEDNKITGWGSFPIRIDGAISEYFAFQNLAKAGPITNRSALMNHETEHVEFDISTWDGSDIFHLEDTLLNVCTPRVKDIFEKAKLKNLLIKPL